MKTIIQLSLVLILLVQSYSSLAQTEYTVVVSPNLNPKQNLSNLTKHIPFSSRYIVDTLFKIRSFEEYDLEDFETFAANEDFEIVFFEKTTRIISGVNSISSEKSCCDLTINMFDSWGDGWDGGFLTVDINGTVTNYAAIGFGSSVTIPFCDGQNIDVSYTSGSWENENSYSIIGPSGTLFSDGPFPVTGLVFQSTDICPEPTQQDCEGAQIVCNNNSFSGNSSGSGNFNDLNASNDGCLFGENQTSWYYVNVSTPGTLAMDIAPDNGTDDYDFALWGPFDETTANANCPPIVPPTRCSYSDNPGSTGMGSGATDVSEGWWGNAWVAPLNASTGDIYILLVDNFTGSAQPFDLDWTGTAGLDCMTVPLPVELISFEGHNKGVINELYWETASEKNNDYFILQYSSNGVEWEEVDQINGAGTTSNTQYYSATHRNFEIGINYYRLIQVDFDGTKKTHNIISIDNSSHKKLLKRINTMGQEVTKSYKGIVILYYSDGSIKKVLQ